MKYNHSLIPFLLFFLSSTVMFLGCKKKDNLCETVSSKGRIIGFNPCRYYTPTNKRKDAGFVIEIDNGITKDTVESFGIPGDLFQFPDINRFAAISGQFLYPKDVQDKFHIKFNYRIAGEYERTPVTCLDNIMMGYYFLAVKDREIIITCLSPQ